MSKSMKELLCLFISTLCVLMTHVEGGGGDGSETDVLRAINAKFDEFRHEINQLKERDLERQKELDRLTIELGDQKRKTAELENIVESLTAQLEKNEENPQPVVQNGEPMSENKVLSHVSRIRKQVDAGGPIAFFATLGNHLTHAGVHQDIVFERVETNEGGSYSPVLGAFTAPVPGTYVFSVTLTAYTTFTSHFSFCKNGKSVSWLVVRGATAPNAVASQTAILILQKGDAVTIQNQDADKNLHGSTYSSFAGFLLHENEPLAVVG